MQGRNKDDIQSPLNLLSQDSVGRSLSNNSAKLQNMYLEKDETSGVYPIIGLPMPVPVLFSESSAEGRGSIVVNSELYVVRGNKFGLVDDNGDFTQLAIDLETSTGIVTMVSLQGGSQAEITHIDNNRQILIFDGTTTYCYKLFDDTYEFPVVDEDAPNTVIDALTAQEYSLVAYADSTQLGYGQVADGFDWEALDFFSKNSRDDVVVGVAEHISRIFIFGKVSTEIRAIGSNPLLPFERTGDGIVPWGLAAPKAKCVSGTSLLTLSTNKHGSVAILEWIDSLPKQVSDPARNSYLKTLTISDVRFIPYSQGGHDFVDCVFPTDEIVMTYDSTTGVWGNTIRRDPDTEEMFLPISSAECYGKTMLMDETTGNIYELSTAIDADNAFEMPWDIISPPLQYHNKLIIGHRATIDVDVRSSEGTEFDLKMSTNGGTIWESLASFTVPDNRIESLYEDNLGQATDFRLRASGLTPLIILGMILKFSIEQGVE